METDYSVFYFFSTKLFVCLFRLVMASIIIFISLKVTLALIQKVSLFYVIVIPGN